MNLSTSKYMCTIFFSTKKGTLLSVSKEIPAGSAFKDYGQLRRHWKNMVSVLYIYIYVFLKLKLYKQILF